MLFFDTAIFGSLLLVLLPIQTLAAPVPSQCTISSSSSSCAPQDPPRGDLTPHAARLASSAQSDSLIPSQSRVPFKRLVKRAALPAPQPHPGFFSRMRNAFRHGLNKVKGAVQTAVTKLVQVKDKVKETAKTVVNATKGGALRLWESSGKKIRTVGSIAATLVGKASEYMAPLVGNIPVVGKALQPMLKAYAMTAESVGKGLAGSNGDGSGSFKNPFVKDMEERVGSRDERGRFHADGKKITGRVVEMAI